MISAFAEVLYIAICRMANMNFDDKNVKRQRTLKMFSVSAVASKKKDPWGRGVCPFESTESIKPTQGSHFYKICPLC